MANVWPFAIAARCGNVMQNFGRGALLMLVQWPICHVTSRNCGTRAKFPRHG
jgi:hypothetical protein